MTPWLEIISEISLAAGCASCLIIVADLLAGHRQHMKVMNIVWPITALYSGPLGVWAYYKVGRLSTRRQMMEAKKRGKQPPSMKKPFWQSVALGSTHCGGGCTLGDLLSEWFVFFVPLSLFGREIFAAWLLDYILAFLFGIAFQYFSIKPMRNLSFSEGLVAALKADTLSLTAWQVGMYGWMAAANFLFFVREIPRTDPLFWFMMQVAMIAGFITSYPVNWYLLRMGIKEVM
jgi:hypothetical protein